MTAFGVGVMGCPSAVIPVSVDSATSVDALADPAATLERASIESTVISPPKSETASAATPPWALEVRPGWAETRAVADAIRTIEPSVGYA